MLYFFLTLTPILVMVVIGMFFQDFLKQWPAYPISIAQVLIPLWLVLIHIWSIEVLGYSYWAFVFCPLSIALIIDLRRYCLKERYFTLYNYFKHATHLIFVFLTAQQLSFIVLGWFMWFTKRL
ncbi:hypothetical protein [Dolosicoccus paucivorans]|uniref:hypothetical protein n=1 Tax=Dolosicoccus paucivorans TaxID=84521 RepID=UPI000C80E90F|nr:hypothetical protein [Dolosicoccus paucivorans]PMB84882.1 hypothetical protein CJ206_01635 [Dolosicoccus paucivorans]